MSRRWLHAVHEVTQRVEVTPRDHVVITGGRAFHIQRVTITHRRVEGEELWTLFSTLWPSWETGRGEIRRNELDRVPAWLMEVEAQAMADLPTSW